MAEKVCMIGFLFLVNGMVIMDSDDLFVPCLILFTGIILILISAFLPGKEKVWD